MMKQESLDHSSMDRFAREPSLASLAIPDDASNTLAQMVPAQIAVDSEFLKKNIPVLERAFTSMHNREGKDEERDAFIASYSETDKNGRVINPGFFNEPHYPHFTWTGATEAIRFGLPASDTSSESFSGILNAFEKEARNISIEFAKQFDERNAYHAASNEGDRLYNGKMVEMMEKASIATRFGEYDVGSSGQDVAQHNVCAFTIQWFVSSGDIKTVAETADNARMSEARNDMGTALVFGGIELAELMRNQDYKTLYKVDPSPNEKEKRFIVTSYIYLPVDRG